MEAAAYSAFLDLIATPTLPGLGPEARAGVLGSAELRGKLDTFFTEHEVSVEHRAPLRAAAFLWHDKLDESHRLSQELPDANGSFLHAIMHRREPDYGNAKYWFHRVGSHPAFPEIARNVEGLLTQRSNLDQWRARLLKDGRWSAEAFVDLCQAYATRAVNDPSYALLQEVQAIEFRALLLQL